ncbi:MAG: TlpA disulfide reductase family protein [Gammaproteobacteria bacterium]|jgi:thiol-disulfide isomerase/thioredoxin|nr:TlpA disulfide reductase family protein [Gammaproteobacteria bacterium]MDP6617239.1 TlpA disulfide reductase family protein [Gammaproteobacteria bacterium]MDP6695826.1 TlpA disulfide reductase family protein [Gammaproteobacteria bacterium]
MNLTVSQGKIRAAVLIIFVLLAKAVSAADGVSWSLDTPDGNTVSFPYEHDEPVILLFWASWCPYCKALMPHLQSIQDEYGESITIYAIDFRDDGDPLGYLQSQGYRFTPLPAGGAVADAYGIFATPGLLIFDGDNRLLLNLYDVMARYDEEFNTPEGLKHSQRASRKAPYWAARIRQALDRALAAQ